MSARKKFIANIGLGYWGKNILRNLNELGVLHTACDSSKQIIAQRREEHPDVNFTTSFEEVLKNPEIKAVAISSPAVTHYEFVKKSLLAGKDVFVEKPLALTVKEGEEIVDIAEKEKRILMVGHILQYHPAIKKLKELIVSGKLGRIQYVYSNRLNIGKLRTEEDILWSFAPHDISVILMLLGEEPVRVSFVGGDYLNKGIFDTTLTILEFKNPRVKGHIFVSWLHPYKEQKLIVVGSKAMVVFDDLSKEKLFLYPHTIEWKDGKIPIAQKADYQVVPVEAGEPLKLELGHFVECVTKRTKPITDGREGLRVLKVLESSENIIGSSQVSAISHTLASFTYSVHGTAVVDEDTQIGKGTRIWHFSHILKGSKIGDNCIIGQNVVVGGEIGNRCKIQNNVSVYKGVVLEDGVFCGPSCVFTNVYNPRAFIERKHEFLQTLVKTGATIGANATIVCGSTIGRYAMVGAGAVVKSDVPDYAVVAGVPARQIGWACKCGTTLKIGSKGRKTVCTYCGNQYQMKDKALKAISEK